MAGCFMTRNISFTIIFKNVLGMAFVVVGRFCRRNLITSLFVAPKPFIFVYRPNWFTVFMPVTFSSCRFIDEITAKFLNAPSAWHCFPNYYCKRFETITACYYVVLTRTTIIYR